MRVLQIGPYSPPHGGIQAHVVALRKFLQENGVVCDVIDVNRFRVTDGAGVFGPRNAMHLFWLLLTLPADVVHLHVGGNLTSRLLALSLICGWLPNRKSILTFHSGGYPTSPEGLKASPRTLRGRILSQFDRVIGVNQPIVDVFKRYGVSDSHVKLIAPHALPGFPTEVELTKPFDEFFKQHHPVMLSVGLLEPEYDLKIQIDVLGEVLDRFPQAGLIMIGSGSLETELRRCIATKPYREHIMLPGDVPRHITLRVIAESDLFLRTTLFDGDSISLREAKHFDVPVIATDRAARPEGVRIIPAEHRSALLQAIELELAANRVKQSKTGPDNRNLEAVLRIYNEMLGE
jgi:glycosyltransferase involved in cell wall biosynthesis